MFSYDEIFDYCSLYHYPQKFRMEQMMDVVTSLKEGVNYKHFLESVRVHLPETTPHKIFRWLCRDPNWLDAVALNLDMELID